MPLIDWNSSYGKRVIHDLLRAVALKPERKSIGWVNVYDDHGRYRISSLPYASKQKALDARSPSPISTYVDTIELFGEI